MSDLPLGTVTLLFSDIEASTEVMKRLGEAWPGVLDRHRALLRAAVESADGVVVDCQGDAMFAAFRSARAGVEAAVDGQARLAREDWPEGGVVRVRMAIHTGEPHRAGNGYTGIDVVHAARLCAAGHGGQVLLTEAARVVSHVETTDLGRIALPDLDEPESVYQLVAPGLATSFPALRTGVSSPLEAMEGSEDPAERVRRAEQTLEDTINARVAGILERALEAPFDEPDRTGEGG
ncbi:MAG TPA: adenylate/guanylate cyclase domain-containing protein [Gaiellales bacterium]